MPTEAAFEALGKTVNQQKGELLYLHALNAALLRALPKEVQAAVIGHLFQTLDGMRQQLLFSDVPEDVVNSFDHFAKAAQNPTLKPGESGNSA